MGRKQSATINIAFQGVYFALAVCAGIFLVPQYISHLGTQKYGVWLATGSIMQWLALLDPGIANVMQERVANSVGAGATGKVHAYLRSALEQAAIIGLIYATLAVAFIYAAHLVIGVDDDWVSFELRPAIAMASTGVIGMLLVHVFTGLGNALQNALSTGMIVSLAWLISLVAGVALLKAGYGLMALGLMQVIQALVGIGGFWVLFRGTLHTSATPDELRLARSEMNSIWKKAFFARAASTLLTATEAPVLVRMLGPEIATPFLVMKKVSDVARIVIERPIAAIVPQLSHLAGENKPERTAEIILAGLRLWCWIVAIYLALLLSCYEDIINIWIGPSFWSGAGIATIALISAACAAVATGLYNLLFSLGEARRASELLSVYAATSAALAIPAVWVFGKSGPAAVTGVAALFISVMLFASIRRRGLQCKSAGLVAEAGKAAGCALITVIILRGFGATDVYALATKASMVVGVSFALSMVFGAEQKRILNKLIIKWTNRRSVHKINT